MKLEYYNYIKEALESVDGIKHVSRWKNQTAAEKIINPLPAAYIEILPLNYEDMNRNRQEATDISFIIHLVYEKYSTEDRNDGDIYELSQGVFVALQRLDNVSRISESMDVNPEKLEDFQLTYTLSRIVDEDAAAETQSLGSLPDLEIETE